MSNLDLWNSVEKTNPAHTKPVNFGRKMTAIDPYQQVKNATEKFGAVGVGWGWSVARVEVISAINEIAVLVRMWHTDKDNTWEQWGQNSLYIDKAEQKKDTDCLKKATTDGITKCLSFIGFNADVFLGKFEDNKYVQMLNDEFNGKSVQGYVIDDIAKQWIDACKADPSILEQIKDQAYKAFIKENL